MKRPIALIDAYSEKMVQETIEGFASNKELHEQLQQIVKEQSKNVNTNNTYMIMSQLYIILLYSVPYSGLPLLHCRRSCLTGPGHYCTLFGQHGVHPENNVTLMSYIFVYIL